LSSVGVEGDVTLQSIPPVFISETLSSPKIRVTEALVLASYCKSMNDSVS
jgi:hypothetical protein